VCVVGNAVCLFVFVVCGWRMLGVGGILSFLLASMVCFTRVLVIKSVVVVVVRFQGGSVAVMK
jgi:hypothetical protein